MPDVNNRLNGASQPLSPADFEWAEKTLGFPLPPDLRAQYAMFNGGVPERTYFRNEKGDEYSLQALLPIRYRTYEDQLLLEESYERLVVRKKLIPTSLLPFAIDQGGDYYCMRKADQAIVFFAMDHWNDPGRAQTVVSASICSWLDAMVTEAQFYA